MIAWSKYDSENLVSPDTAANLIERAMKNAPSDVGLNAKRERRNDK